MSLEGKVGQSEGNNFVLIAGVPCVLTRGTALDLPQLRLIGVIVLYKYNHNGTRWPLVLIKGKSSVLRYLY